MQGARASAAMNLFNTEQCGFSNKKVRWKWSNLLRRFLCCFLFMSWACTSSLIMTFMTWAKWRSGMTLIAIDGGINKYKWHTSGCQHSKVMTKWPPFCRWHFQTNFLNINGYNWFTFLWTFFTSVQLTTCQYKVRWWMSETDTWHNPVFEIRVIPPWIILWPLILWYNRYVW